MTAPRLLKVMSMKMRLYATPVLCVGIVIGIVLTMLVLTGEVRAQGMPDAAVSNSSAPHSQLLAATPIPTTYTLHAGEYPYCIARRFNVNPAELLSLNGLTSSSQVTPGQVLQIPQTGHPFPGTRALHPTPAVYTVKTGDTIYTVACYYGDVDPLAIAAANGLSAPYSLTAGQTLQIPGSGPTLTPSLTPTGPTPTGPTPTASKTMTPLPGNTYTLQAGEYPYCIARRFNVNPDELLNLNGLSRYRKVSPGVVLQIPQTGHTFPGTRALHPHPATYTVVTGDTIYTVACYYGDVEPMAIVAANSLVAPYTLTAGQTLQIPGVGPSPTSTPTTGATSTPTLTYTPTATATATATATPLAFTSCASIVGLTQPADCDALVALYNGTNGATWTNRTSWLATNAPCSWYGVACTSGRVTQLILNNNNLLGTLPTQLGNLTNLTALNLASNQLSGNIPTELGNLVNLSSLYFQENALSGEIPTTITNLSATVNFNIGYNMLSSTNATVITFLNGKQATWASTQTVPPTNVLAGIITSNSVQLSWTPITYTADGGSYEVLYATTPGGPYTSHGNTSDKTATGYIVTGLTPSTPYYFVVRSITPAHGTQQNFLTSSYSVEISAATTP